MTFPINISISCLFNQSTINDLIPINLLEKSNINETKEAAIDWLSARNGFTDKNNDFGLKIGDVITFIGGHNKQFAFTSEIFAFDVA